MTTAFDVPAESLISAVSKELKENDKINTPTWAMFVKQEFIKNADLKTLIGGM